MCTLIDNLDLNIKIMKEKIKPEREPGFLHFRVFGDYIRDAVEKNLVTWSRLGLEGERGLCQLELDCLEFGEKQGYTFPDWLKHALIAKLKKATGAELTRQEEADIIELFPAEADTKIAA